MKPKYIDKRKPSPCCIIVAFIWALLGLFLPSIVNGGGLFIYKDTLLINDKQQQLVFKPGEKLKIRYFAQDYSYSGHKGEYGYHVFRIVPKIDISGAVGNGGKNNEIDVKNLQRIFKIIGIFKGETNGIITDEFIQAIYRFQKSIDMSKPDGRVDPQGKTLLALQRSKDISTYYFVVPARIYSTENSSFLNSNDREPAFRGNFITPELLGEYDILYSRVTLFSNRLFSDTRFGESELSEISRHFDEWGQRMGVGYAVTIKITSLQTSLGQDISIYVRVNNKLPYEAEINSGLQIKPIVFSWYTKPEILGNNISFQYRLYPGQNWSDFSRAHSTAYFFISEGQHEFQVRGRYVDRIGVERITPVAKVSFSLSDPFVSQPTKGTGGFVPDDLAQFSEVDGLYEESCAIVIGITNFIDSSLSPLPFASRDAQIITDVLKLYGFKVHTVVGAKTKFEITKELCEFLSKLKPDSRIIIYFSTHGIQHPAVKSRVYLAAADCDITRLDDTCIPLSYIEDRLSVPLSLPLKHTAIILDACATGIGVFLKSSGYREMQIASKNGAHMMTAGMADQLAQGDTVEGVSYFTKFLVQGLEGDADYTKDGIITLSELLIFTRYKVAEITKGTQIPMMGRILGPGEMIFNQPSMEKN